jgi:hypothetical protein
VQERFYLEHPELRGVVRWTFEAPPHRKRPDDPKPAVAAIEHECDAIKFHRAILKAFHSDIHGKRKLTCDEVVATVNRLWEAKTNA